MNEKKIGKLRMQNKTTNSIVWAATAIKEMAECVRGHAGDSLTNGIVGHADAIIRQVNADPPSVTQLPSPDYDGEVVIKSSAIKLVDDSRGPPLVDFYADLRVAALLPTPTGLQLGWTRRSVWLQVPVEHMLLLAEGAQVPLTTVKPASKLHGG